MLIDVCIVMSLGILEESLCPVNEYHVMAPLYGLWTMVPRIAVLVRRLHDTGRSGWWLLFWFVPLVGGVCVLVFLLEDGTLDANRYGPSPKDSLFGEAW